jgi:hypothetical protein
MTSVMALFANQLTNSRQALIWDRKTNFHKLGRNLAVPVIGVVDGKDLTEWSPIQMKEAL